METADASELQLLYQVTTADLAYFKTQQWTVANYALLLDAGVVGVTQLYKAPIPGLDRIALVVLFALIGFAAAIVLGKLEKSISVRRARLESVRRSFGSAFSRAWSAESKGEEYFHSVYFLFAAVLVTASLSSWLVLCRL
jgi:hypothetical protein